MPTRARVLEERVKKKSAENGPFLTLPPPVGVENSTLFLHFFKPFRKSGRVLEKLWERTEHERVTGDLSVEIFDFLRNFFFYNTTSLLCLFHVFTTWPGSCYTEMINLTHFRFHDDQQDFNDAQMLSVSPNTSWRERSIWFPWHT